MYPIKTQWPRLSDILPMDDLRSWMNQAYVTREHVFAANSHYMVMHKTHSLLPEELIAKIGDKIILFDKWTLQELQRPNIELMDIDMETKQIHINFGVDKKNVYYPFAKPGFGNQSEEKLKMFHNLFDTRLKKQTLHIDSIGLNPMYLEKVTRALDVHSRVINCFFDGQTGQILVYASGSTIHDGVGILMPAQII